MNKGEHFEWPRLWSFVPMSAYIQHLQINQAITNRKSPMLYSLLQKTRIAMRKTIYFVSLLLICLKIIPANNALQFVYHGTPIKTKYTSIPTNQSSALRTLSMPKNAITAINLELWNYTLLQVCSMMHLTCDRWAKLYGTVFQLYGRLCFWATFAMTRIKVDLISLG